jgi:hypothetical protein
MIESGWGTTRVERAAALTLDTRRPDEGTMGESHYW